jgi:putative acetyltransferase
MVGSYPATAKSGGGYVWDAVLEYRVWCHPERGAPDDDDGNDYFFAFATYEEALEQYESMVGAEEPLALILQEEYIDEPEVGAYVHVKERRVTEWPVEFLRRPRRTPSIIPDFLSPNAPPNKLDILRGTASASRSDDLPLGYTPAWLALGIVTEAEIQEQVKQHTTGEDPHSEHYRWRSFSGYLSAQGSLSPTLSVLLYELGAADADMAMGGSMMAAILRREDCPSELLRSALTSPRSYLRELAAKKMSL